MVIFMWGAARASTFVCAFAGATADTTSDVAPSIKTLRRFIGRNLHEGWVMVRTYASRSAHYAKSAGGLPRSLSRQAASRIDVINPFFDASAAYLGSEDRFGSKTAATRPEWNVCFTPESWPPLNFQYQRPRPCQATPAAMMIATTMMMIAICMMPPKHRRAIDEAKFTPRRPISAGTRRLPCSAPFAGPRRLRLDHRCALLPRPSTSQHAAMSIFCGFRQAPH